MFRRFLALSITVFTLTFSSTISSQVAILQPGSALSRSVEDTLRWRMLSEPTVNFWSESVGVEDTIAVWFKPSRPCSLIAVRIRSIDFEGDCLMNVWDGSHYDGHITTTDSTDSNGWIGGFEDGQWIPGPVIGHSPLGWEMDDRNHHYWGQFPFVLTEYHAEQWVEIPISLGQPEKVFVNGDPFFIAVTLYQTYGHGWAAEDEGITPYHTFRYYNAGHQTPGPSGHYGWHIHRESVWFEVIVKYVDPSSILDESDPYTPTQFNLFQNYPNPFNSTTSIRYSVVGNQATHHSSPVTLKIFNLLGQEVKTLVNDDQEPGDYTVTWDGRNELDLQLPSGVYFYRLEAAQFGEPRKMVLLK